jgi:hypothetical protein
LPEGNADCYRQDKKNRRDQGELLMRRLRAVALIAFLSTPPWVFAQSAPAVPAKAAAATAAIPAQPIEPAASAAAPAKPAGSAAPVASAAASAPAPPPARELVLVSTKDGKKANDFRVRLGETLVLDASGDLAKKIAAEFGKSSDARELTLYLDGVRMIGLPTRPFDVVPGHGVRFGFDLVREANIDENRKAWDTVFKTKPYHETTLHASVAVGSEPPRSVHSPHPLRFYVADLYWIYFVFIGGIVLFFVLYVLLVKRTGMLIDADTGFYSLGKSQMAFWGLMVLLSFFGVWILTGTMERIPPQALVLLGISGATGLTAIFIGTHSKEKIDQRIQENKIKLHLLEKEQTDLEAQKAQNPSAFRAADEIRLLSVKSEIATLMKQLKALAPQGFWYDIVNDGNGMSFHRAQVVVWTIVLGMVFVGAVRQVMSMPEFPETLLVLMGISNATYLGFKIPERGGV